MPPHLTETWASVYLQILIGLLIFALGIPAFVLQLVVHEDIRHVTEKRMRNVWWKLAVFVLGVASVSFIWYLHPQGKETAERKKWIASLIVTLTPLSVAYLGYKTLGKFKRERVVDDLQSDLIESCRAENRLEMEALEDLIYLGANGKAGYQKDLVLTAYREVARAVQTNTSYKGKELKELILSLADILRRGEIPGSDENYITAAELLYSIRANHSMASRPADQDANAVSLTLRELAIDAVRSKSERTALKLLNIAQECNSDLVLRIGILALQSHRFLVANAALNILETAVLDNNHEEIMEPGDAVSRLLGLISHFAASGEAAAKRARIFFTSQIPRSYSSLSACLKEAFQYHYNRADFQTADLVDALLAAFEKGDWPWRQNPRRPR